MTNLVCNGNLWGTCSDEEKADIICQAVRKCYPEIKLVAKENEEDEYGPTSMPEWCNGPPGIGKTAIVEAAMREMDAKYGATKPLNWDGIQPCRHCGDLIEAGQDVCDDCANDEFHEFDGVW